MLTLFGTTGAVVVVVADGTDVVVVLLGAVVVVVDGTVVVVVVLPDVKVFGPTWHRARSAVAPRAVPLRRVA